jgi:hypothetical protein
VIAWHFGFLPKRDEQTKKAVREKAEAFIVCFLFSDYSICFVR